MKNILKLSFLAGFMMISASMMAKDGDFSLSFVNVKEKTISFEVKNAEKVSLTVYSDADGELYHEKVEKPGLAEKFYNFAEMPEGTYYLIAESASKVEKYKIQVERNKVSLDKTPISEVSKPVYTVNGNMVNLHLPNVEGNATVAVYDLADNEYYNGVAKPVNGELNLKFDLDPASAEGYVISIQNNGNVFNKVIALR